MKDLKCAGLFILILHFFTTVSAYKILVVCPVPAKSHNSICKGVVDALVDRGHDLTFITGLPAEKPKYRELYIKKVTEVQKTLPPMFSLSDMSPMQTMSFLTDLSAKGTYKIFEDEGVKKMLDDISEKFDLVIYEHLYNKMFIGFGVKYRCPVIALSSMTPQMDLSKIMNNPLATAVVPNVFTTYVTEMSLKERILNTASTLLQDFYFWFKIDPILKSVYKEYFPIESRFVPFEELDRHVSSVLSNSHPSFAPVRPFYPNTIEIGGYHINEPESLPDDLKEILDDANDGVIYFSMGSNLKSSEMSPDVKKIFLEAFKNLKETIIWKYEENLPDKPDNVIIRKWAPQTGILAHPNVKLFITHGGMLSFIEAIHYGVPLLVIPIYGDQPHNARTVEHRGYGKILDFKNITDLSLIMTLEELLDNPEYSQRMHEVHRLYHDRPMRPRDLLIYHVEHIIRTKGGKHLSPPILSRSSHLLIDVFVITFIPFVIVLSLIFLIAFKFISLLNKRGTSEKQGKKPKKQ